MAGGIVLTSGFDRNVPVPLDLSFTAADNTARDAVATGIRYQGMLVYVTSTKKMWQLQGGITNADWKEAGGGGGGGFNNIVSKTTTATLAADEDCVLVDATLAAVVLTLPPFVQKLQHNFIRMDNVEANTVTIQKGAPSAVGVPVKILTEEGLVDSVTLPYLSNKTKLVAIKTGTLTPSVTPDIWGVF